MKTNQFTDLVTLQDKMKKTEYKKVEYDTTPFSVNKEEENYKPNYINEISKISSSPLSSQDIIRLKKWVTTYGYWYDQQKQFVSIHGDKFSVLKVKNQVYLKNISTGELKNMNKEYRIAIFLNKTKLATKLNEFAVNITKERVRK